MNEEEAKMTKNNEIGVIQIGEYFVSKMLTNNYAIPQTEPTGFEVTKYLSNAKLMSAEYAEHLAGKLGGKPITWIVRTEVSR